MTSAMTSAWEYKTVVHSVPPRRILNDGGEADALGEVLTGYGLDGWELVHFTPVTVGSWFYQNSETKGFVFVFKRQTSNH